jgi:hypothetical protein
MTTPIRLAPGCSSFCGAGWRRCRLLQALQRCQAGIDPGEVGLLQPQPQIESHAGQDLTPPRRRILSGRDRDLLAARFAAERGLPVVGGSDSHHLPTVGRGYTLFPGRTANDLRRSILSCETRAEGRRWGARCIAEVGVLQLQRSLGGFLGAAGRA